MRESELHDNLQALIDAGIIVAEPPNGFAFRHALTRDAAYASLLVRDRKRYHALIAAALEQDSDGPAGSLPAQLSYHYYQAGLWHKALTYARQAGERAAALYAQREAIQEFTRALEAARALAATQPAAGAERQAGGQPAAGAGQAATGHTSADPRDPAAAVPDAARAATVLPLLSARARAYETLGEFEPARADYEAALGAAREAHDAEAESEGLMALGFLWAYRDYQRTGELLRQASALARTLPDQRLHAHTLNRLGNWMMNTGQVHAGLRLQEQALALFTELRDKPGMAATHDMLAMTWSIVGDLSQTYDHAERAIPLLRELDDKRGLVSSLTIDLRTTFTYETLVEADAAPAEDALRLDEAQQLSREMNWPDGEAVVGMLRGPALALLGDFDAGLAASAEALQIATRIEHREWIASANHGLGGIYCMLLQPERAIPYLQTGLRFSQALNSALWSGLVSTELALAHLMRHEQAEARAVLEAAWPRGQRPLLVYERRLAWAWARWALANGEPAVALRAAGELLASAPGAESGRPIPSLLLLRAEALAALGVEGDGGAERARLAEQALLAAARGAEHLRQPVWQWPVHAALARLYQQLERGPAAEAAAAQARAVIAALAATVADPALRAEFVRRAEEQFR